MSEEEKKAVEFIQEIIDFLGDDDFPLYTTDKNKFLTILDLLEKQQKELNSLKEIEKFHQEENGKLRIEFEKVYEDNLTLAQELEQEKEKNKNTGKLVENKIDGTIGIVLREWETGQIQVLEKIQPEVINTHDSWKTLEVIEDE